MFGQSCDKLVFEGITAERFTELEAQAAMSGIAISGDSGSASADGIRIAWDYDRGSQMLTVQCTEKPFVIPCSAISSRLQTLIGGYTV